MLTTYEYDDQGRMVRSYTASPWTEEDRALTLAWDSYESSQCRCGHPKDTAWHPDNDGWFEVTATFTCQACTALARESNQETPAVEYYAVSDTRDYEKTPLPPFPTGARLDPEELSQAMGGAE